MRNSLTILFILFNFVSLSQLIDPYRDSDQGNFHLRNGKVFFQKTYNSAVCLKTLEKKLTSYNTPNAGFQIKKTSDETMNGIIVNYHLNWNYKEMKTRKIAHFLKNPVNATFEVTKNGNAYQVVINNLWFSDIKKQKNKTHNTLESIVTAKNGLIFTKNKKVLKGFQMMDENFQLIFQVQGSTKDTRF